MKTKITKNSKIALLALILFSPIFFSPVLFSNLQAQEQKSSKTTGWFVGINHKLETNRQKAPKSGRSHL